MILSGHQPCYLPGLQLFNKIMHSDAFMYVPHCQFQKGSWHHHNFIRTGRLTVPVKATLGQAIDEVSIDQTKEWQRKHIRSIELAYRNYPFFDDYFPIIKCVLGTTNRSLSRLNLNIMHSLTWWLCRGGPVQYSTGNAEIRAIKDPIDMIIAMCKHVGADSYLSNEGARAYIGPAEEARMADAGITHKWQRFTHPDYGQDLAINNGRLSVIDLLFAKGPEARDIIYNAGGVA